MSLLEQKLQSLMGLPGRTELVLTDLKIDVIYFTIGLSGLQRKLRTDTLQDNVGKSSCFELKPVWQANNFEEIDTLLLILALELMKLYIDATYLVFPSLIRCSLLA